MSSVYIAHPIALVVYGSCSEVILCDRFILWCPRLQNREREEGCACMCTLACVGGAHVCMGVGREREIMMAVRTSPVQIWFGDAVMKEAQVFEQFLILQRDLHWKWRIHLPLTSSRNTESLAECTTLCHRGRSLLWFLWGCFKQRFGNEHLSHVCSMVAEKVSSCVWLLARCAKMNENFNRLHLWTKNFVNL